MQKEVDYFSRIPTCSPSDKDYVDGSFVLLNVEKKFLPLVSEKERKKERKDYNLEGRKINFTKK